MKHAAKIRSAFAEGKTVIGGHLFVPEPSLSEAMAYFGYEAIWIDGEHGAFDKEKILQSIVATEAGGAASFVRVAGNDPFLLKPVLEMGPDGIIVPMVSTPEEARRVVEACRYPPRGRRGFGPRRAARYGAISTAEYVAAAEAELIVTIQIEHVDGVENLPGILAVPGIDAVVIGPFDLSASAGLLGMVDDPRMYGYYERAVAECKRARIPVGVSIGPADESYMASWARRGLDFIFCGDELAFMAMGAKRTLGFLREALSHTR
ncbi:MAG TPA: aldolase/citrate lyase family protein [Rectinemataceae bacterium]